MLSDFQSKTNKREAFIGYIFDTVRLPSKCVSLNFNGMYTLYFPMHSFFTYYQHNRGRRGRDRMVVGFTTTYACICNQCLSPLKL